MQTNSAIEQNKTLNSPRVHGISPVGKEKVYLGKDLLKSQVLSSEWNTERVKEDASGDSEDGEDDKDDELPCVIGESAGDCVWRGSRRSVGSSTRCSIPKRAISDFQIGPDRWTSKSDHRRRTCFDKVEQKSSCGDIEFHLLWEPYMLEKGVYI